MQDSSHAAPDRVIDETYATTLNPERYEALLTAWSDYVETLPDDGGDDAFQADGLNTHFQRALAILDRMGRVEARDQSARMLTRQMPGPALVLKPDFEVLSCNGAALDFLGPTMPAVLADLGLDPKSEARLKAWINPNAGVSSQDPFLIVSVSVGKQHRPLRLLATRISLRSGVGHESEEAVLLAAVDVWMSAAVGEHLAEHFALSSAEIDVAVRLAQGDTPDAIARARKAKLATVRTQIRAILSKMDVASVTEAVRMLTAFSATLNAAGAIARQAPSLGDHDRWQRQHQMTLSDGRRLNWLEMGDPKGRPVLFFHHLAFSPSWTASGVEALSRQGWRVIAPSRPGFGLSDRVSAPTLERRVEAMTRSCTELVDRLEVGRALVMGHANGLIHAQDFCARNPARVCGLISVGGETSWEDGMEAELPWHHGILIKTMMRAPSAIGFLARAMVAFIDAGREEFVLRSLHQDSPLDQRVSRRPEVREVILGGLRHTVQQGANGLAEEIGMVLTDWRDTARQVRCPFHIIHGLQDTVFKPQLIERFAASVPGVNCIPVEDAGQYLLYSHWPQVLSLMEAAWREAPAPAASKAGAGLA